MILYNLGTYARNTVCRLIREKCSEISYVNLSFAAGNIRHIETRRECYYTNSFTTLALCVVYLEI